MTNYIKRYLKEVATISQQIDQDKIDQIIKKLINLKKINGRIFFLGVGGSAANCSHAVNDFRKISNIDAYTPMDNVAEITARTNDEGWKTVFSSTLQINNLNKDDILFIFSVGGGNKEENISVNLIEAIDYANHVGADIIGIVGRDGGYVAKNSSCCIIIPTISLDTITPHAESWQSVIWHLIVTDPRLLTQMNKWESIGSNN